MFSGYYPGYRDGVFSRLVQPLILTWNEHRTRVYHRRNVFSQAVRFGYDAADRLVLRRLFRAGRPEPSKSLKRRLIDVYRDDISQLEGILNRDLSAWTSLS